MDIINNYTNAQSANDFFDDHDQKAVNQSTISDLDPFANEEEIIQYKQNNPFYLSYRGSPLLRTPKKVLADKYQHVYIMCLREDFRSSQTDLQKIGLFFEKDTTLSELTNYIVLVTLVQGPFSLINLPTIRRGIIPIGSDVLERFNHECYELNRSELVYLMLETTASYVREWLSIYNSENLIDKFRKHKLLSGYYQLNDPKLNSYLISLINQGFGPSYWEDPKHCQLGINHYFVERKFNFYFSSHLTDKQVEKELEKIINEIRGKNKKENTHYPPELTEESQKEPLSKSYQKQYPTHFFQVATMQDMLLNREQVRELLVSHCLSEKEKYYLICNLLSSNVYCHYVLNDAKVLRENTTLINKYKPIFRYLISYAWITLYKEENIRKTLTKECDRYVFDLDVASLLPVFPFDLSVGNTNPYFTLLVSNENANLGSNIGGVKSVLEYQDGIVDLAEFKRRLNIFITGNENCDILAGVDWSHMALTGGLMAAIIPKKNPLIAMYRKGSDSQMTEEELRRFFMEYYRKSDIDIACNHDNILDFLEHVKKLKAVIKKNLGSDNVHIIPNKTLAIYINANLLKEKCRIKEIPFDYETIIKNKNKKLIKFYFYELYINQKNISNSKNKEILKDKLSINTYFEIINYAKLKKTVLVINDTSFETEVIENRTPDANSGIETVYFLKESDGSVFIKFTENLRFKIVSPKLVHPFEVFLINGQEFFSTIARFHLPCVRSYYNGNNCYLLPSAITAYHTLTNIDFKYFVGAHDPISIIDKYRMRGYGTILNKTEIGQYLTYVMSRGNYKKAYNAQKVEDLKSILGNQPIDSVFFKPRMNLAEEYPVDTGFTCWYKNDLSVSYCDGKKDINKYYESKYPNVPIEFFKGIVKTDGHLEPLRRWMIDAIYDLCC